MREGGGGRGDTLLLTGRHPVRSGISGHGFRITAGWFRGGCCRRRIEPAMTTYRGGRLGSRDDEDGFQRSGPLG